MKSIFRPETNWFGGGGGLYDFFESSPRIGAFSFFVFLLRGREDEEEEEVHGTESTITSYVNGR